MDLDVILRIAATDSNMSFGVLWESFNWMDIWGLEPKVTRLAKVTSFVTVGVTLSGGVGEGDRAAPLYCTLAFALQLKKFTEDLEQDSRRALGNSVRSLSTVRSRALGTFCSVAKHSSFHRRFCRRLDTNADFQSLSGKVSSEFGQSFVGTSASL